MTEKPEKIRDCAAVNPADLLALLARRPADYPFINELSPIRAICADSRRVQPGDLFVAVRGQRVDGHRFIDDAIAAGAQLVVAEDDTAVSETAAAAMIIVENSRDALGLLAAAFHNHPQRELTTIGITGTNGKTTCSYLLEHALMKKGVRVGVIGTVEYRYRGRDGRRVSRPAAHTTPEPLVLYGLLREMADAGVSHLIMEVSSHALAQQRIGPLRFDYGLFTNLSQDHLDYHSDLDDYFQAKALLFENHLKDDGCAVICRAHDDSQRWSKQLLALCEQRHIDVVTCGPGPSENLRLISSSTDSHGLTLTVVDGEKRQGSVRAPLIGNFNVANVQLVLTTLTAMGYSLDEACSLLAGAAGAPGRMEPVSLPGSGDARPTVLVDYAHTPDALSKALTAARALTNGTLFVVCGCGGDRDRAKRSIMGAAAARLADVVIITDDNPRTEEPSLIRRQMLGGVSEAKMSIYSPDWLTTRAEGETGCVEIAGRAAAIAVAVTSGKVGDIVLIAGKGHERYQQLGDETIFFDDALWARQSVLSWNQTTVAEAVGGRVINKVRPVIFKAICTDSRRLSPGDLFVALRGESFDGHDFLDQAVLNGAAGLLVEKSSRLPATDIPVIVVGDTLHALGDLAKYRRRLVARMNGPVVVGVTGSCGKTTVKEMTAAIFARRWPDQPDRPPGRVLKTSGNFNNLVGLPLSLLPIGAHHRAAVLEMGMNETGEIARLTRIAEPDICCIVNVRPAHLEKLGSVAAVAHAKAELFTNSKSDAIHIVNCDDDQVFGLARSRARQQIGFAVTKKGIERGALVYGTHWQPLGESGGRFVLTCGDESTVVELKVSGRHNMANGCAAAAIARAAGIDPATIAAGLSDFRSPANRLRICRTSSGINVLNDSYNANPASMEAGLLTLAEIAGKRARGGLLGDMLELGDHAVALHEQVGRHAANHLDYLACVGEFAYAIRMGAIGAGMEATRITVLAEKQDAVGWLAGLIDDGSLSAGDWLLIKASRGIGLETVVDQLCERE